MSAPNAVGSADSIHIRSALIAVKRWTCPIQRDKEVCMYEKQGFVYRSQKGSGDAL